MKVLARPRGQLVQSRCGRRACVVLGKGSPWTPGRETQRRVSLLAAPAPCRQPSKSQNRLKSLRVLWKSTIQLFPSGRFWGWLSKFALRSFFPGAAPLTAPYFHASRDPPGTRGAGGGTGTVPGLQRVRAEEDALFPRSRVPPTVIYFVDFQLTPASSFSALLQ